MLTDDELDRIQKTSASDMLDRLIAQAREANKLRVENERLRGWETLFSGDTPWEIHKRKADLLYEVERLRTELANAQRMLTLFGNQMAEMHKVVEASLKLHDKRDERGNHIWGAKESWEEAIASYRSWLAVNAPPPTNVHAVIMSMVVARGTTIDGESKLEAVTVTADGTVKP